MEPLLLGLALAPTAAGLCLSGSAVATFLVRQPLRLALMDRRKRTHHPRTALAESFVLGYGALALALLGGAIALAQGPFWLALALAAPFALLALGCDARGRSRDAVAQSAGAVALAAAAAAIALAGGVPRGPALAAWGLIAARAVPSVLYVRARLRLDRGLVADVSMPLAGHGMGVGIAALLAAVRWAPWLGVLALGLLLARAASGLSSRRPRLRPQALGLRELGWGLLTLLLLISGYRLGW